MLKIFDSQTARKTFLRRVPVGDEDVPASMLDRIEGTFGDRISPQEAVTRILRDIRSQGDSALHSWTTKLDGKAPNSFRVPGDSLQAALSLISAEERSALELAARRIEAFYRKQPGRNMARQAEVTASELEEAATARLSPAERSTLMQLLRKIYI